MAKIRIEDLPQDENISTEKMKKIMGGIIIQNDSSPPVDPKKGYSAFDRLLLPAIHERGIIIVDSRNQRETMF